MNKTEKLSCHRMRDPTPTASLAVMHLRRSMCQSSPLRLLPFLLLSRFRKSLAVKEATLCDDKHHSYHIGKQESKHVQRVVLVPGEVMRCHTKVLGPFVVHDRLNAEDSSVQGLHCLIVVDT